jgi:hypothetical protein
MKESLADIDNLQVSDLKEPNLAKPQNNEIGANKSTESK